MSTATTTTPEAERMALGESGQRKERSPFVNGVLSLRRNKAAMGGMIIFVGWLLIAVLAPLIAPDDPLHQNLKVRLASPNSSHLFGTDELGRDIFSRVLYGARISVPAGLITIAATLIIGVSLGAVAGYLGGWLDAIIMRA